MLRERYSSERGTAKYSGIAREAVIDESFHRSRQALSTKRAYVDITVSPSILADSSEILLIGAIENL